MRRCIAILCLFWVFASTSGAQEWPFRLDYVENISPLQYKGDIQVWDIVRDANNYVYFATASGLSVWDGVRWTQYKSGDDSYLRALCNDDGSRRIYSAGNNEFGFWTLDRFGDFKYTRLWNNETSDVAVFWRCGKFEDKVYFQSQTQVFVYDPVEESIESLGIDPMGRYLHVVDGKLFIQSGNYLLQFADGEFVPSGIETDDRIVYIGGREQELILVTESKGIQLWDGYSLSDLDTHTNQILSEARVFSANSHADGHIIVGTILDGLYIIDPDGKIVSHIGSQDGLRNTTVLSLASDAAGRIWLGLDGGAAVVDNRNNEMYYFATTGKIGSVYTAVTYRDKLYMGTNKGLYELDKELNLRFIPDSQGQVWSLFDVEDNFVVCHDQGLYMYSGKGLTPLNYPSAWCFRPYSGDVYFSVDMTGLSIYEIKYGRLMMRNKLAGFYESHDDGYADKYGYIWMLDHKGVPVMIKPDRQLRRAESVTRYEAEGVNGNLLFCAIDNEVIFYTDGNAYVYDIVSDKLKRSTYYSELISMCGGRPLWLLQVDNSFFYIYDNLIGLIERHNGRFYKRGNILSAASEIMIPKEFRTLTRLNGNIIAVGVQNGMAFYNLSSPVAVPVSEVKLRSMNVVTSDGVMQIATDNPRYFKIPGNYRSAELYFTGLLQYKTIDYRLDGGKWITEVVNDAVTLTKLSAGRHDLEVRNSGVEDQTTWFSAVLEVDSVWYYNKNIIAGLVVFALICAVVFNRIYIKRLDVKHETERKKQEEELRRQSERHEMEMMRLAMKEKDKKLINFTMEGISRNNMLNEIREEVMSLRDNLDNNPGNRIRNILRSIDSHLNDKENWEVFKKYYNNIHDGFFDRLFRAHPNLTSNDMKICAYLKLNLTSKEIAILMNISTSSVEIARYRLRKKLGLDKEKSLTSYIAEI